MPVYHGEIYRSSESRRIEERANMVFLVTDGRNAHSSLPTTCTRVPTNSNGSQCKDTAGVDKGMPIVRSFGDLHVLEYS